MDANMRTQVILAAVQAAGPADADSANWSAKVQEMAGTIMAMTGPKSSMANFLDKFESATFFRGSIVRVDKHEKSGRGIVTLFTGTDKPGLVNAITNQPLPAGFEQIRTDFTNTPQGLSMAVKCSSLIGHQVLVWRSEETFKDPQSGYDKKMRVLIHVEDLGLSQAEPARQAYLAKQQALAQQQQRN